ncbi:peroxiredoxin family protein [Thermodesulfobacteriota bacterium]
MHKRGPGALIVVAVVVLFIGSSVVHVQAAPPEGTHFQPFKDLPAAYDFNMTTLKGEPVVLSQFRGKVVVLNFWRRNCRYCEVEKKHFQRMMGKLKRPDIEVVCVNLWDDPSWVRNHASKKGRELSFVTAPKAGTSFVKNVVNGRLMGYYVLNDLREAVYEIKMFPTTYVIDKKGRVVAAHLGMAKWDSAPVLKWMAALAGDRGARGVSAGSGQPIPKWLDRLMSGDATRQGAPAVTRAKPRRTAGPIR